MDAQSSREMLEITGSEQRPELLPSGGIVVQVVEEIQQRPDLGWGQLLGSVIFFLVLDVFIGCTFYFVSCGKACKLHFSGVTGNDFADSLYFSSTTLTTTGFGDIAPTAPTTKAFTALYIAWNTFYINYFVYPPFIRLVQIAEGRSRGTGRRLVLALGYCLICLVSGMSLLMGLGGLGWGNAAYTFVVSFSSTGYGDYTFTKKSGRIFNSFWLLVSHLVNYCLGGVVTDAGGHFLLQSRTVAGPTAARVLDDAKKSFEDAKKVADDLRGAAHVLDEAKKSFEDAKKAANDLRCELLDAREEAKGCRQEHVEAVNNLLRGLGKSKIVADDLGGRLGKSKIVADDLGGRLGKAKSEADDLRGLLVEASNEADDLRGRLVEAKKEVDDLRGRLGEGKKEADDLRVRLGEARKEVNSPEEEKMSSLAEKPSSSADPSSIPLPRRSGRTRNDRRFAASF